MNKQLELYKVTVTYEVVVLAESADLAARTGADATLDGLDGPDTTVALEINTREELPVKSRGHAQPQMTSQAEEWAEEHECGGKTCSDWVEILEELRRKQRVQAEMERLQIRLFP